MEVSVDLHLNTCQGRAMGLICMFGSAELSVRVAEVLSWPGRVIRRLAEVKDGLVVTEPETQLLICLQNLRVNLLSLFSLKNKKNAVCRFGEQLLFRNVFLQRVPPHYITLTQQVVLFLSVMTVFTPVTPLICLPSLVAWSNFNEFRSKPVRPSEQSCSGWLEVCKRTWRFKEKLRKE